MGLKDFFGNIAGKATAGTIEGLANGASNVIEKFVTDPTAKMEAEKELAILIANNKLKAKQQKIDDKNSARAMYNNDSSLQKVFAIVFLVGFIGLVIFLVYSIFFTKVFGDMENWKVALLSTIFTSVSVKINTITDFLFGGSTEKQKHIDVATIKAQQEKEQKPKK